MHLGVSSRYSDFLPQPKDICLHVIGEFKLVVAVRQMKCMCVPCSVQCAINAGIFTRVLILPQTDIC